MYQNNDIYSQTPQVYQVYIEITFSLVKPKLNSVIQIKTFQTWKPLFVKMDICWQWMYHNIY